MNTITQRFAAILLAVFAMVFAGCASNQQPVASVPQNQFIELTDKSIEIVQGYPRYNVNVEVKQPVKEEGYVLVTFENPANTYSPIIKREKLKGDDSLTVVSRGIDKIRRDQEYKIKVDLIVGQEIRESVEDYVLFAPDSIELISVKAQVL